MLFGTTPWPADSEAQLVANMRTNPTVDVSESSICRESREFIEKTLQVDFYNRMSKDEFKKITFDNIDIVEVAKSRLPKGVSPAKRIASRSKSRGAVLAVTPIKKKG